MKRKWLAAISTINPDSLFKCRESVREMFPEDLSELIIQGDDKTRQELWDMQVLKAQKYLEEINRTEAPVMSYVAKERADEKAASGKDRQARC